MTSSTPTNGADLVAVGKIGRAHGVRGAVFVEPWTDAPEERFCQGSTFIAQPRVTPGATATDPTSLTVDLSRDHSGKLVVQFMGVTDRGAAERLTGTMLYMRAADRPVLTDDDEFYDSDLVDLVARFRDGTDDGVVTDVLHIPSGSVLAIDIAGREVLMPFRREIVPVVDLTAGYLEIDPPAGLMDL